MKKTFEIGPGLTCDADRLVASRLLVQANSGGGKTRTLRRLLEQSHGRLQHLVIDPEGEYHTLREHFDYVLASPSGGDTVAHPRTAAMLAERLLQLNVSAILDIYELNPDQRVLFVQRFLDALVNAPRDLWHPVLIVLDEAHVYAPEGKENASTAEVKAMASRGRKRGFCLVSATQRLSKLSKDVAAECNNKLIGRCTLDVDIKRATEKLNFTSKTEQQTLRHLEPGQFYGYGPAFDVSAPVLVKVGSVKSHHPEPGQKAAPVPAPTDKVKKVLQQLADLPAEAEEREKSISELRKDVADKGRRIKELERERAKGASNIPANIPAIKEVPALTDADRALIEKLTARLAELESKLTKYQDAAKNALDNRLFSAFASFIEGGRDRAAAHAEELKTLLESASVKKLLEKLNGLSAAPAKQVQGSGIRVPEKRANNSRQVLQRSVPSPTSQGDGTVDKSELKILTSLAELEALGMHPADKVQIGFLAGYTNIRSGGFSEPVARLVARGLVTAPQVGKLAITDEGRAIVGEVQPPSSPEEMQARVMEKLSTAERKLLGILIENYPNTMTKEELGAACDPPYTNIRSGGFSEPVARLNMLTLVQSPARGTLKASPALFLEGR